MILTLADDLLKMDQSDKEYIQQIRNESETYQKELNDEIIIKLNNGIDCILNKYLNSK